MTTKIKYLRLDANAIKARFIQGEGSDIINWLTSPQTKNELGLHFTIHEDDDVTFTKNADKILSEYNSLKKSNYFEITKEQIKNTHISDTQSYGLDRPFLVSSNSSSNSSSNRPYINPVTMGQKEITEFLQKL
ncbi:hypothetical protein [Iodobacter sp.]|uniref:hypothetical protein n=1 Tax=Iodobacter sp. TaxID=1915058 RepID=UPI0025EA4815|nr:hypothetical protein [Iodobacter sp.]